jgi:hypothetical protein
MPPNDNRSMTTLIYAIGLGAAKTSNDRPGGDGATATTWPWRHRHSRSKRQPACRNLTDANPRLKGTRGLELKVCALGRLILSGARIPVQRQVLVGDGIELPDARGAPVPGGAHGVTRTEMDASIKSGPRRDPKSGTGEQEGRGGRE